MEMFIIFIRTVFVYFFVLMMMRIMGKREIGKLSVFDLVISIMIAEIAVLVLEDVNTPMLNSLFPMITLVAVQIFIAFISLKSRKIRLWLDGYPSILVDRGRINRQEMRKQKYNLDDLMQQLRENKVSRLADVEFAILETTGKLTVIEKEKGNSDTSSLQSSEQDVSKNKIRYVGLPIPLIMDGKVQDDNLEKIEKNRFWLKKELQDRGVNDFKEVFFCSMDYKGEIYIDKKRKSDK